MKTTVLKHNSSAALKFERHVPIFAALGDSTRLSIVAKLIDGKPHSISSLTSGTKVTRQAVTKHLTVLENVGLVLNSKVGRESLYELNPKPLKSLQEYLDVIAAEWEQTLTHFKDYVENKKS